MRIVCEFNTEEMSEQDRRYLAIFAGVDMKTASADRVVGIAESAKVALPAPEYQKDPIGVPVPPPAPAAVQPEDSPEVGAPTTQADMTMLGFGNGATVPPAGAVMVPPAPPAPVAPPAPPAPPTHVLQASTLPPAPNTPEPAPLEFDSKGTPWHVDIHSSPPTKKENGEWRSKRGVDKAFAAAQAEQLRRLHAGSAADAPTPPAPPAPKATTTKTVHAPTPPAPPAPPSMFAKFMQQLTPYMIGSGQPTAILSDGDLTEIAKTLGLVDAKGEGQVSLLQQREDMIPKFGEWVNYKIQQINAARAAG